MKKNILFFLGVFAFAVSYAQPNFTSADMPNIGDHDTVRYLSYYGITNNLDTETGNGYTWDFSALPFSTYPNFYKIDSFRSKTHIVSQPFTNATIEEFVYDGTAGDVNLFSFGNDTLYIHRLGAVVTGLSLIPPIASIAFPIPFNQTSTVVGTYMVNTLPTGQRLTTVKYDGFGTLKMPGGRTYTNVFRVKKVEKDTNYVAQTSITYTNYIWYKQGGQVPLLRLAYTGSLNLYFVFGSMSDNTSSPTGINELNEAADFSIYPNPSNGKFRISGPGVIPDRVEVYNVVGERVFQGANSGEIDISGSPKGIYFVNIMYGTMVSKKKIQLH